MVASWKSNPGQEAHPPRISLAAPRKTMAQGRPGVTGWLRLALCMLLLIAALVAARSLPLRHVALLERTLAPAGEPAGNP